ncbi:MAG: autotransporter-associated beta strand repeat-containing protein, partial [Opitutaceae bacterium]|nr:autotransporter-associated beta strand repeat-containing protein [Opitutaceae bacterium]
VSQGTDFSNVISGTGSFTQAGGGTTTMAAGNTYTGTTTISAGTLALAASNAFADASNFVMSGGTFAAGTFSDVIGTLSLTGNAALTLGSGGALAFADSDAISWGSNTLSITGTFVDGFSIRFGTDATGGLTSQQLALISINGNFGTTIDSSGFLVAAIPEPSTYAIIAGGAILGLALLRRRRV